MTEIIRRGGWPRGIDNRSGWRTQPEGTVRDAVNVDPLPGGTMALRAGFERVYSGTNVRGALASGRYVLVADGTDLVAVDTRTASYQTIAQIAGAGRFIGAELAGELFFCTENQTYRFRDGVLRPWGVPEVTAQPTPAIGAGGLAAGAYQWAITQVDGWGDEGPTTQSGVIQVQASSSLTFTLPATLPGGVCRLYMSPRNGATLYQQYEGSGPYVANTVTDDGARLDTMHLRSPVVGAHMDALNGVIAVAEGRTLWMTLPFRPHLRSASRGFFQFADEVGMVVAADGGFFVSADKTYFIGAPESASPTQATIFDYPALTGSATRLPDRRAAWMTKYGLAVSNGDGTARLVSEQNFVPQLAEAGSSGIVERNGNQLVVSTVRGVHGANPMAAGDYYEAEIITP